MRHTRLRSFAVPVLAFVVTVVAAATAAGQAPKTPWGDPDIQGIWSSSGATPFERPDDFQGRETLTEEEVAEIRGATEARNQALLDASAQRTQAGGNVGAYNNFWMERGRGRTGRR